MNTTSLRRSVQAVPQIASACLRTDRLSVLLFHRVLEHKDPLSPGTPTRGEFATLMRYLKQFFNPIDLAVGVDRLQEGSLPPRAVAVTFDDGYLDNLTVALPEMERYGIPSTVFVTSAYLDGGLMWNDRIRESMRAYQGELLDLQDLGLGVYDVSSDQHRLRSIENLLVTVKHWNPEARSNCVDRLEALSPHAASQLMLDRAQLAELARRGVTVGAHTHTHPILASLTADDSMQEIQRSKEVLESALQCDVTQFAYPNGKFGRDFKTLHTMQARAAGFHLAVSTDVAANTSDIDPFQVQRFTPWGSSPGVFYARLLHHIGSAKPKSES